MNRRMRSAVARFPLPLAFLAFLATAGPATAEECVCRLDGAKMEISNFPQTQKVKLESLSEPIDVREVEIRKMQTFELDVSTGEKEPLGPIPLTGWRTARIQITQISPKTASATPVTVHWFIRNHSDDAFFDPCRRESSQGRCTYGLPPEGAKLTPLLPSLSGPTGSERLEGFTILSSPVSIAPIDLVGAEALLVVENAGAAPRSLRIYLTLEK
jgi:hypothetical protein